MSQLSSDTTIVFITGASEGIGLQVARTLSTPSLHPSYHVIIGSLTTEAGENAVTLLLKEDPTRSLSTVQIDVTSDASIQEAAAWLLSNFGRVDILINNAGVLLDGLNQSTTSRSLFQRTFEVNLFGAAAVTESLTPLLAASTKAHPKIIFMTSRLGSLAAKASPDDPAAARFFPHYRSSKCALNMVMLHYASVFGEKGWAVYGCDPGITNTDLTREQNDVRKQSVEDGAREVIRLATEGSFEESGRFANTGGVISW
ncbi:hypothetical protein BP5796_05877 [Coleophoma crateriformis]|uniref:Uncharacterized protein n=1 Tax=Coleophoma crateriformis TaxID=565419 RepID=A0A3D8RVK6_9HELO|nr:hypothetical protein BP5796_05877 [Coleophoma crateriformis]